MKSFYYYLLSASILGLSCASLRSTLDGEAWAMHASAEKDGFDQVKLDALSAHLDQVDKTTGMVVIHQGQVVYQYGNVKKVSYIASCRKSVLSMLYGKHVENGTIDLNETIGEIGITEKDSLLPSEKQATVDHIITSRSGVFHVASNGGYDLKNFKERGSMEPGEYFVYNNWDFNVAGEILERKTGKTVYQELEEQLAIPLGFEDWNIKNQRKSGNTKNSQYLAYHIYVSTRDMAKIGQLMLNEGEWKGKQIISKDWIKKTTSTVTPMKTLAERYGPANEQVRPSMSYGYMWWLFDKYRNNPDY
ncbi:MAG: serine hydrolase, partial [Bacteroidota bacterium]